MSWENWARGFVLFKKDHTSQRYISLCQWRLTRTSLFTQWKFIIDLLATYLYMGCMTHPGKPWLRLAAFLNGLWEKWLCKPAESILSALEPFVRHRTDKGSIHWCQWLDLDWEDTQDHKCCSNAGLSPLPQEDHTQPHLANCTAEVVDTGCAKLCATCFLNWSSSSRTALTPPVKMKIVGYTEVKWNSTFHLTPVESNILSIFIYLIFFHLYHL